MKQYWPMATFKKEEGPSDMNRLFTYDSCMSMKQAKEVIRKWANDCDYHLLTAWVDCDLDGKKRKIVLF